MSEQMQIKQHEPTIEIGDIWKDDRLNSKEFANRLTDLLRGQTEPLTIALNGAWGTGKTFLLKRWCEDLKSHGYKAIYFNAWEDDHLDDPLVAIIGQILIELKGRTFKCVCSAVKQASKPLIKKIGLNFIKNSAEMIPGIDLSGVEKKDLETASEAVYDDYLELTKARNDLRRHLQELANRVYNKGKVKSSVKGSPSFSEKEGSKGDKYPLVFIVDELDRCRPTFAISVLERIKHLFNIDHIVFVLGVDKEQLGKSIQSVYGEIDVDNYLHRFFDLEMNMLVSRQGQFVDALWERYQIEKFLSEKTREENHEIKKNEGQTFRQMFISVSQFHHFSLREIEQCLKVFAMIQNSIPERNYIWPELLVILLLIKLRFRELYSEFIEGKVPPNFLSDKLFPQDFNREHFEFYYLEIALYASFVQEYPNPQEKNISISSLLEDAQNGNVQNNGLASKRLKMLPKDDLQKFAKSVTDRSSRWYDSVSMYNNASIKKLRFLVDMFSLDS